MSRLRLLLLAVFFVPGIGFGETEPVALDAVEDGVYSLYHHEKMPEAERRMRYFMQTTILELKDGRYRYWSSSDLKIPGEPDYPVSGVFTKKGGTVTMEIDAGSFSAGGEPKRTIYLTHEWKAMRYHGEAILWPVSLLGPPVAGPLPHNTLLRTSRKPEEIWRQETSPPQMEEGDAEPRAPPAVPRERVAAIFLTCVGIGTSIALLWRASRLFARNNASPRAKILAAVLLFLAGLALIFGMVMAVAE